MRYYFEGFWRHFINGRSLVPYPISSNIEQDENFIEILKLLMNKCNTVVHYNGHSHCRLCNKTNNGSSEYLFGIINKNTNIKTTYIFPEGYLHYVTCHNLLPSEEFKNAVFDYFKKDNYCVPSNIDVSILNQLTISYNSKKDILSIVNKHDIEIYESSYTEINVIELPILENNPFIKTVYIEFIFPLKFDWDHDIEHKIIKKLELIRGNEKMFFFSSDMVQFFKSLVKKYIYNKHLIVNIQLPLYMSFQYGIDHISIDNCHNHVKDSIYLKLMSPYDLCDDEMATYSYKIKYDIFYVENNDVLNHHNDHENIWKQYEYFFDHIKEYKINGIISNIMIRDINNVIKEIYISIDNDKYYFEKINDIYVYDYLLKRMLWKNAVLHIKYYNDDSDNVHILFEHIRIIKSSH
jgi:hypothetical protein